MLDSDVSSIEVCVLGNCLLLKVRLRPQVNITVGEARGEGGFCGFVNEHKKE